MELRQNKDSLIESLRKGKELLKDLNGDHFVYIEIIAAIQSLELPELDGNWEYTIKRISNSTFQIIKHRLFKKDGIWWDADDEVVEEFDI